MSKYAFCFASVLILFCSLLVCPRIEGEPFDSDHQEDVSVVTDQNHYTAQDIVTVTVRNNLPHDIWIHACESPPFVLWQYDGSNWLKRDASPRVCNYSHPFKIKPQEEFERRLDLYHDFFYLYSGEPSPGKSKLGFRYALKASEILDGPFSSSFSNEFEIVNAAASGQETRRDLKAEIAGILHFQDGHGFFISVKNDEFHAENQIWLWISEDKVMVKHLSELTNKEVIARGYLEQMPETVNAAVPKKGMYLRDFNIHAKD